MPPPVEKRCLSLAIQPLSSGAVGPVMAVEMARSPPLLLLVLYCGSWP